MTPDHAIQNLKTLSLTGVLLLSLPYTAGAQRDISDPAPDRVPFGMVEGALSSIQVVTKQTRGSVERGFLSVTLPDLGDSIFLDVAELVITVSTSFDSTEPLIIAAHPATVSAASRAGEWSSEWTEVTGEFNPEYMGYVSVNATEDETEIRLDVTTTVRLWLAGGIPNYGFVIKSLSEDKSTFHWVRDGRYGGTDARLEIRYSRI